MARIRNSRYHSPRHLVFRHARRVLRASGVGVGDPVPDDVPPGNERLVSYYVPVQSGPHTITVKQDIAGGPTPEPETVTTQMFDVVGPQFSLPSTAIHSTYPPQGQQLPAETLPHVIFNDPTLPWERVGSWSAENTHPADYSRNRVPWLAVLVFEQAEIKVGDEYMPGGASSIFPDDSLVKSTPTFAVNMPVQLTSQLKADIVAPAFATPDPSPQPTDMMDTLFMNRDLFVGLFAERDKEGGLASTWKCMPYVAPHRLLAHRRDVNTQGMAVSGTATEDDSGSFGVVFSGRSGPSNITVPTAVFVHLVSIEGIESMANWPPPATIKFVALPSLASWSYICLPPDVPNVWNEFENLGSTLELLRPVFSAADASKLPSVDDPIGKRIMLRLSDGYTLSRYRTQTGEVTACFTRGPLVPADVQPLPEWWPAASMAGTNLQILDQELGIMDLTYSVAWQVGRTMGIADQAFTTALYRVRRQILQLAISKCQTAAAKDAGVAHKGRTELLQALDGVLEGLRGLGLNTVDESDETMRHRWEHPAVKPLDMRYHGPSVAPSVVWAVQEAALDVAGTPDPKHPTQPVKMPMYDESNTPFSTDWAAVLKWVLDRLFLAGIPAQYLLSDASHLPSESLRFFKVDPNWTAALVDGALSYGNHIDQQGDPVRYAIKYAIKQFLATPNSQLKYPHPLPQYGCYIRSKLVSQFPDMVVQVDPDPALDGPPVLLSHSVVDDGTMLCMFSTMPSESTFTRLRITQPPHQQSFVVGDKLLPDQLTMSYSKAYTYANPPESENVQADLESDITWHRPTSTGPSPDPAVPYLWTAASDVSDNNPVNLHTLVMENFATHYLGELQKHMGTVPDTQPPTKYFDDNTASSALMAYQCNNPSWSLWINLSLAKLKGLGQGARNNTDPVPMFPLGPPRLGPTARPQKTKAQSPASGAAAAVRVGGSLKRAETVHPSRQTVVRTRIRAFQPSESSRPPRGVDTPPEYPLFSGIDDIAGPPQYQYLVWAADKPGTPCNLVPVPMRKDQVPQDLVFSIRLQTKPYNYFLQKIEITIPFGAPGDRPIPLAQSYDGPRHPAMLSNLRLTPIVLQTTGNDNKALVIRIFPRTMELRAGFKDPDLAVTQCVDLSFMLTGVTVNIFDAKTNVTPTINEWYTGVAVQQPLKYPPNISLGVDTSSGA